MINIEDKIKSVIISLEKQYEGLSFKYEFNEIDGYWDIMYDKDIYRDDDAFYEKMYYLTEDLKKENIDAVIFRFPPAFKNNYYTSTQTYSVSWTYNKNQLKEKTDCNINTNKHSEKSSEILYNKNIRAYNESSYKKIDKAIEYITNNKNNKYTKNITLSEVA